MPSVLIILILEIKAQAERFKSFVLGHTTSKDQRQILNPSS